METSESLSLETLNRDKPTIQEDLDVYLPKGKKLNWVILQGHASVHNLSKTPLLPQDRVRIPECCSICPAFLFGPAPGNPLRSLPSKPPKLPMVLTIPHFPAPPHFPTGIPLCQDSPSLPALLPRPHETLVPPTLWHRLCYQSVLTEEAHCLPCPHVLTVSCVSLCNSPRATPPEISGFLR